MNLLYKSTRDAEKTVTASQAILKGLADDGGLFVPVSIPKLPVSLGELKEMTYQEIAYTVMKEFLTDFTEEELKSCIAKAYDSKFDTEEIAPLVKADGAYYLELFHGAPFDLLRPRDAPDVRLDSLIAPISDDSEIVHFTPETFGTLLRTNSNIYQNTSWWSASFS